VTRDGKAFFPTDNNKGHRNAGKENEFQSQEVS
jgi:hypothetical protein